MIVRRPVTFLLLAATALSVVPLVSAAPGRAETREEATADCEMRFFGPGSCKCFIDHWATYSPDVRALVTAVMKRDKVEEQKVRLRISHQDLDRANFFMATVSSKFRC